jgi:triacylglycerol lipase
MSRIVPYSASKDDLYFPAKNENFFPAGLPDSEAALCAEMSRLAYCRLSYDPKRLNLALDQAKIRSIVAGVGFSDCRFFESHGKTKQDGTHCFLALREDTAAEKRLAVVAFRGTDKDDPTDVAADLDARLFDWKMGGKVHEGFFNALSEVRTDLEQALQPVRCKKLFTGHSLGAALATLLASLRKDGVLCTFGSPQVGDAEFAATLRGVQNRRYVDCCDIVTRLPGIADYEHCGELYYIDRNGLVMQNPDTEFIAMDRLTAEGEYLFQYAWRGKNIGIRSLADHAPINYVSAVTAAQQSPPL